MDPKQALLTPVILSLAAAAGAAPAAPQAARQGALGWPHHLISAGDDQLLGCNGNGSAITPGGLIRLDPTTFAGMLITDSVTPGGLSGLALTPDRKLWGSLAGSTGSSLFELDLVTGAALSQTPILSAGIAIRVTDLAVRPGTGTLYAIGGHVTGGTVGELFTIDTATAAATFLGATGLGVDGGLAFDAAGTLWFTSSSSPVLATLDPVSGAALTTAAYGPLTSLAGLVVRPSDGALLATRGEAGGGDLVVEVDTVTGATTPLGSTGTGTPSDLEFTGCPSIASAEVPRNAVLNPPNLAILAPGATSGPVVGSVWDPTVIPSPGGTSLADALGFAFGPLELPALPPPNGVILCNFFTPPGLILTVTNPGSGSGPSTPFAVKVPDTCALVGVTLCVQGAYIEASPAGKISLTNALDITIGSF